MLPQGALGTAQPWTSLLTMALCLNMAGSLPAEDWLQWRGPARDGTYQGAPWPDSLDEKTLVEGWRVKLEPSYSGPIIAGERVFTTETIAAEREAVRAFDRHSGKELWKAEWKGALIVPFFAWSNGNWIRATPACDGETLFVPGMRDVLVALDVATGEQRWRIDFVDKFKTPLPAFGFVSSPLLDGEFVYVQAASGVVKLNKRTGEVIWRNFIDEGGMNGSAFASPVIATIGGVRQLVIQAREKLAGLSCGDGATYWEQVVPAFRGMNIITPTITGDLAFTSSYGGKTTGYRITNEATGEQNPKFRVETAWMEPAQGYMSSPIVREGHAYLHLRNQRFACFEVATGKRLWTTQPFGKYWSLVANKDRLLALDENGELLLIQPDPREFKLLDRRKISEEETWAHLAIADQQILIRQLNALVMYRWQKP